MFVPCKRFVKVSVSSLTELQCDDRRKCCCAWGISLVPQYYKQLNLFAGIKCYFCRFFQTKVLTFVHKLVKHFTDHWSNALDKLKGSASCHGPVTFLSKILFEPGCFSQLVKPRNGYCTGLFHSSNKCCQLQNESLQPSILLPHKGVRT